MNKEEKDMLKARILELNNEPGGAQAIKFLANSLGSIFAATTSSYNENIQKDCNESVYELLLLMDDDISNILNKLDNISQEPTESSLSLLFGESLGFELPETYDDLHGRNINVILHNDTLSEFKNYEEKGWITIISNGNIVNMGSGNRMGDSIEDLKRPYGMGTGFTISINKSLYN